MHLFIIGVLSAQFTYIAIQWLQLRYREYLYYGTYIGTFIVYLVVLFKQELFGMSDETALYAFMDHWKRPLAFLLYYEYFVFAQYFLDLKTRFPRIHARLQPLAKAILGFMAVQLLLQVMGLQYTTLGHTVYYSFCIFLFIAFVVFISRLWHTEDQLMRYVLWASLSVSAGAFITNLMIVFDLAGWMPRDFMVHYFLPSCIGVFFEIYFFNSGLAYKISLAEKGLILKQQDLIRQLSENEQLLIAQQRVRNKLAQDLHDDIGATLSGIALHSHMAREGILHQKTESVLKSLNLIQQGATEMVRNLNEVVWTVNPKNDTVEKMLERLKEYTFSVTMARNITVQWNMDASLEDLKFPMEYRRTVYLICKEAVNNAVKYSGGTELYLRGEKSEGWMIFTIRDNGVGFRINEAQQGNGLRNMRDRARETDMKLDIESSEGGGTLIRLACRIGS